MPPLRLVATLLLISSPALADNKADALAEMVKAQDELDRGNFAAAIARFNVARALAPDSSGPYLGLGLANARAGRCEDAIAFLREYLRRKPTGAKPEARTTLYECERKAVKPPGRLTVLSDPPGAEVRIDDPNGTVAGTTPFESTTVPNGAHKIYVGKSGFQTAAGEVTIAPGTAQTVALALQPAIVVTPTRREEPPPPRRQEAPPPRPTPPPPPSLTTGTISLDLDPAASVTVNGVQVSQTVRHFEAPMSGGTYQILVERDGYRSVAAGLLVTAGQTAHKSIRLQPLRKSTWLALAVPFTLLAAGTGIGALVTFYQADGHPPGSSFDTNKTANAVLQGLFYPSLAVAAIGYVLYGVLNRGRVSDGPAVRALRDGIRF
jgi:hypothetical protein